jgi:hypothetical protein
MTVQEATKKHIAECRERILRIKRFAKTNKDADVKVCEENVFVLKNAMESLKELEQYRALGTVEELKEARKKQIAKSPSLEGDGYCPDGNLVYDTWYCPNCDKSYEVDYDDYDYCPNCGQKIDKSEMGD